jgi:HEAT repeat protein
VLKRAGDAGAKAVHGAYAGLDATGRARAVEIASSMPCDVGAQVLIGALGDREAEIARRAKAKLERCGKVAAPALIASLGGPDLPTRGRVAPILSAVAPVLAIDPLARAMGEGTPDVRSSIRGAFARAIRGGPKEKLAALLGDGARPALARLDLLRASTERLADVAPEAKMALDALLGTNAEFATRYLALEPLAALARSDQAMQNRLIEAITRDEAWPVRARAAEVAATVPGAQGALVAAIGDPEPRVRESAVRAVGEAKLAGAALPAEKLLESDPWTFVRVAAAATLGALAPGPDIDAALASAVKSDASYRVRAASIAALGVHKARAHAPRLVASLENKEEHHDVRIAAAHALGGMCEVSGVDALTSAARMSVSPIASLEDLTVATAALRALSAIHPRDLKSRLEPLLSSERAETKRAAEAAITDKATCP